MTEQNENTGQKFEYGTLEEAERRAAGSISSRQVVYCPLRKGCCRTDCECFRKPNIVNQGSDEKPFYECDGGYCTAYTLVGPT